ncbi:MAG: hypothetical protein WDO06_08250 [Actinomycetota bacterium]
MFCQTQALRQLQKPSPFTVVPKVAGIDLAKKGCTSIGSSLALNNAFLKLPAAQQTEARKAQTHHCRRGLHAQGVGGFQGGS